jgi:aldehyde:ferredoxin oxidoreductase
MVQDIEDLYTIIDSMILCKFSRGTYYEAFEDISKYYTLVTGIEITPEELKTTGARINTIGRLYNIREGFTRKDDTLPAKVMSTPIPEDTVSKGSYITQEELDFMLDDYYETRGWTNEGVPTKETLKELGLKDFFNIVKS